MGPNTEEKEVVGKATTALRREVTRSVFETLRRQVDALKGADDDHTLALEIQRTLFTRYWRWVAEGKPKYRNEQYYFDSYHRALDYDPTTRTGTFYWQLSDSVTMDVWAKGEFEVDDEGNVVITAMERRYQ